MTLQPLKVTLALCLLLGCTLSSSAQKRFGCMHTKSAYQQMTSEMALQVGEPQLSDTFDILHTTLHIDLTSRLQDSIYARAELSIVKQLPTVQLSLYLKELKATAVFIADSSVAYSHIQEEISLPVGNVPIGDTFTVTIDYSGTPFQDPSGFGGLYLEDDISYVLGVGFVTIPHGVGRTWFPCFDNFVERCTFTYHITAPEMELSFANGTLTNDSLLGNGARLRTFETTTDFPSYLAAFSSAEYTEYTDEFLSISGENIPVSLAALQSDSANLQASFLNLEACFHAMEERFGAYQWEKVGYALTDEGAMEHPGVICYPKSLVDGTLAREDIMAHELAHHWFGNLITTERAEEMWINEGYAEYLSHLFSEWIYDRATYLEVIRRNHLTVLERLEQVDDGHYALDQVPLNHTYGLHSYQKGAATLHGMRTHMGDSLFYAAHKAVLSDFAFQDINSQTLQQALSGEGFSGAESFFDNFIFQPGWTHFQIDNWEVEQIAQEYQVIASVWQQLYAMPSLCADVPIDITFYGPNEETQTVREIVSQEYTTLAITLPFSPIGYAINTTDALPLAQYHTVENILPEETFDFESFGAKLISGSTDQSADSVYIAHHYVPAFESASVGTPDRYYSMRNNAQNPCDFLIEFRGFGNGRDRDFFDEYNIESENNLRIFYRANPSEEWANFTDLEPRFGTNLTNSIGSFLIPAAPSGEYTLAYAPFVHIEENTSSEAFKLFPVPGKERLYFTSDNAVKRIKIYDSAGRIEAKYKRPSGSEGIDISHLARGNHYWIEVTFSDNTVQTIQIYISQ